MKVLHIIDSLGLGGAQTVVKGFFEAQRDNNDIFLYALRQRDITTDIAHKNIFIDESSLKYSLKPLLKLREIIEREEIEILHCHLFRSNISGFLLKKIWFPKIKLIIHEHGGIDVEGLFYRKSVYLIQSKVNKFIAVSRHIKDSLISSGVKSELIVNVPNFVDLEKFNRDRIAWDIKNERAQLGLKEGDYVVGFAGRIIESKGWREFIEVANKISKISSNIKYLIAGDGKDLSSLRKCIENYDLKNDVIILGHVKNMLWFYSLIDCFVFPSHREGMPMTQLEVLAMDIPLISAASPGLTEVVNIARYPDSYFVTGDIRDLQEKILRKINSNKKEEIDVNIDSFSIYNFVKRLSSQYERL